jgi:TolB-like protein
MGNLFTELQRRNVVRVGIAYIVLGWVALQAGDIMFDMFEAPAWVGKSFAALLLLGFPFACLFAWAFELTPEGVKKTAEVDRSESVTHSTGKRLNVVIIVALVGALGYFIWERQGLVEVADESVAMVDRSIAVLPFVNMSSDQEQEWFADGLTEEILNSLARTPDLLVASRTSSFQYKGQNTDVSTIAKALGVAHILEGSVRRGGDRLRVTAQLIRASDGFHLWSETFDRKPEDVIAIQEDVAFEIANALETAMDPEALKKMVSAGTSSVPAFEAYLEGLALEGDVGSTGNPAKWADAVRAYERATALDKNFSQAYWYQALFWVSQLRLTNIGGDLSPLTKEEKKRRLHAVIDAGRAAAPGPIAAAQFDALRAEVEFRFRDAIRFAETYIEAHPYDIEGLNRMVLNASVLRDQRPVEKHLEQIRRLVSDDPLALNALLNNLLFVGLEGEALNLARSAVERFPEHAFILYQSHRVYLWNGLVDEGRALLDELLRSDFERDSLQLAELRQACAGGDTEAAGPISAKILGAEERDLSLSYIVLQIMSRPDDAHQLLIDAELDLQGLSGFMNYPYFNHTYFPEVTRMLEQQSAERQFIDGPPYRCETT